MRMIPVPGRPSEEIEALTDEEVAEMVASQFERFPRSWAFALACEVKALREKVGSK